MVQSSPDHLLETLIEIVSDPAEGVSGVTLTVMTSGPVVSGVAISADAYLERLSAELEPELEDVDPDVQADLETLFASLGEVAKAVASERETVAGGDEPPADAERQRLEGVYIYMKDVSLFGDGLDPAELPLWCGRLADVVGWSPGQLSPSAVSDSR